MKVLDNDMLLHRPRNDYQNWDEGIFHNEQS